jgi:predicted transcriptional regulator
MPQNGRRVNMTMTVPLETKARVKAYAQAMNNRASRIVENAINELLGAWGTDDDPSPDAAEHRALVAQHLEIEQGRRASSSS